MALGNGLVICINTFNVLFPASEIHTKGLCFEIKIYQILVMEQRKINFEQMSFLVMFYRVVARKNLTHLVLCISESCIRIKSNLNRIKD